MDYFRFILNSMDDVYLFVIFLSVGLIFWILFIIFYVKNHVKHGKSFSPNNKNLNFDNAHLVKTLLSLDQKSIDELFKLYQDEFGTGAASYGRKTYQNWKDGKVRPNKKTFQRFLIHLPKVMSYDLKCEILRHFMEEYCSKIHYNVVVFTDDWEKTLTPLVQQIIDKTYLAELPKPIAEKLEWLADGEMQTAKSILKKSQEQESIIAVSMLQQEFLKIENLLDKVKGKSKVTHKINLSYGTVTLNIKRR